ncbi:MAG: hypothetical protein J6X88_01200 [Bacteroidales bacterium]|nr:hypothetical protein [Bacteroidales bacterium]
MEVRVFTLCDGAYNYNGKLTIVGTIDNIKVPKTPVITSVGLAIKIALTANESGKKKINIYFKTKDGELMAPEITFDAEIKDQIIIAGIVDGIKVNEIGDCVVELMVGNSLFTLPFKIVK